jgi:hypothetical protein
MNKYIVVPSGFGGWDQLGYWAEQKDAFFKGGYQAAMQAAVRAADWQGQFHQGYCALVCRYMRGQGWQVVAQVQPTE